MIRVDTHITHSKYIHTSHIPSTYTANGGDHLYEVHSILYTLGVIFSKAQSSKLERLFCHVSVKRDLRALSFEL